MSFVVLSVAVVTVIAGMAVSLLVCIFAKSRLRNKAGNVLLWQATALAALLIGASHARLPESAKQQTPQNVLSPTYLRQADLAAAAIRQNSIDGCIDRHFAFVKRIPLLANNWKDSHKSALEKTKTFLNDLHSQHPGDPQLAARFAIVLRECGEDPRMILAPFFDHPSEDQPLIAALNEIGHDATSVEQATSSAAIKSGLPQGWYQDAALLQLYKGDSPERLAIEDRLDSQYQVIFLKSVLDQITIVVLLAAGIVTVIRYMLTAALRKEPPFCTLPQMRLKMIYACMLAALYAQAAIGLVYTLWLQHKVDKSIALTFFDAATLLASLIVSYICMRYFIFAPAKIPLLQGLELKNTPPAALLSFVGLGFLGICATLLVAIAAKLITLLFVHGSQGSSNPIFSHLIDAISTRNPLLVLTCFVSTTVLAPLAEEPIFRRLLYTWCKQRWGILPSALLSAIVFSLIHMDFGVFWTLTALGFVLALIFEKTKNLAAPIIAHGMWNGLVVLHLFLTH